MSEVEIVPLSVIVESLESGVSVNSEERPALQDEWGVLKTSAVADGRFYAHENKAIHPEEVSRSKRNINKGDLIISRMNTPDLVGACGLVNQDCPNLFLPDRLWRVVFASEKRDSPLWLAQVLNSDDVRAEIKLRSSGTSNSMKNLSQSEFLKIRVARPSFPEQIEIARILGVWDAAIGEMTQLIAAKTQLKRGLMQQLLTGERRFAEFKGQAFISKPIGEVMELQSRLVDWDDEAIYHLASVRRNSGGLFWREALRGDQIKVKKLHTVSTGDFLISHIQAAYGAMGCVSENFNGGHVSDMYSILTPRQGAILDIRFVDYLSQMPVMHQHILRSSNGFFAERLRLNFDPLEFLKRQLDLPPTLEEQQRIADVLDAATREINLLKEQLDALKIQKRGLMQRLLSGDIRVTGEAATSSEGNLEVADGSDTGCQS